MRRTQACPTLRIGFPESDQSNFPRMASGANRKTVKSTFSASRKQEIDIRPGAQPATVVRQMRYVQDGRVSADEEVWQNRRVLRGGAILTIRPSRPPGGVKAQF